MKHDDTFYMNIEKRNLGAHPCTKVVQVSLLSKNGLLNTTLHIETEKNIKPTKRCSQIL